MNTHRMGCVQTITHALKQTEKDTLDTTWLFAAMVKLNIYNKNCLGYSINPDTIMENVTPKSHLNIINIP